MSVTGARTSTKELRESQKALHLLASAMLAGAVSVAIYAAQAGGAKGFFAIVSVGILRARASAFIGDTLSFLFGIARTLQQEGPSSITQPYSAAWGRGSSARRVDYRVSTNLDRSVRSAPLELVPLLGMCRHHRVPGGRPL
jgi:hypothetical protein